MNESTLQNFVGEAMNFDEIDFEIYVWLTSIRLFKEQLENWKEAAKKL